jgi:hypothetical protein
MTWRMIESATQPAAVTSASGTTVTTGSFTPVAGTLLVAMVVSDSFNVVATGSVTDNVSGVWTLAIRSNVMVTNSIGGSAEVWWRYVPIGGTAMAVTTTLTSGGQLVVRQILGAHPVQNGPVIGNGGASVPGTVSLVSSKLGSRVYGTVLNWANTTSVVANANSVLINEFSNSGGGTDYASFKANFDSLDAVTSFAYGVTAGPQNMQVVAMEILPMPLPAAEPRIMSKATQRSYWW